MKDKKLNGLLVLNLMTAMLAVGLLIILGGHAFAANKNEWDVSRIGVGAQVMGMGGWGTAWSDGVNAALMNPAGLANVDTIKGTSMYSSVMKEFNYMMASAIVPLGYYGTVGLTYLNAYTDAAYARDGLGNPIGNPMTYSDNVLMLGWGIPLRNLWRPHLGEERMIIGANLKLYSKTGIGADASGMGLDLGAIYHLNRWSNMGFTWKNVLLNNVAWSGGTNGALPSVLKLGYAANVIGIDAPYIMGEQELILGGDLDLNLSNEGGMLFHAGAEYWPLPYLALRGGLDQTAHGQSADTNFTLGLGFQYSKISFDYAYHPYTGMPENDTHYFSLSYLGDKIEKHYIKANTPEDKLVTGRDSILIQGTVLNPDVSKVFINEEEIKFDPKEKTFSKEVPLKIGKNKSQVIAVDEYGYVLEAINLRQLRLSSFSDVEEDYWAALPIRQLSTLGLIDGYPDGTFQPEGKITRAEVAALLAKVRNTKPAGTPVTIFSDVKPAHWAAPYVVGGYAMGLVTGYPDGTFGPKNNITRAEGVALVTRFDGIKIPEKVEDSPYEDVAPEHWAASIISVAKEAGLLDYLKSAQFEDKTLLTRGETVQILISTAYVQNLLSDLYNWDSYQYHPKEKIVVERNPVTIDIDKLRVIDDAVQVELKLTQARVMQAQEEKTIEEATAKQLEEGQPTVQMVALQQAPLPTIEPVYDTYLPAAGAKRKVQKLEVSAVEISKTGVKGLPKATKVAKPVKKVEAVVEEESVEAEPQAEAAPVEEAKSKKSVFTALKGALLGRALVDKEEPDSENLDKFTMEEEKSVSAKPSAYADQIQVRLGPDTVTTKVFIKVKVPAAAKATKLTAHIKETGETVVLEKRTAEIWAGVYNVNTKLKAGSHELSITVDTPTGKIPAITNRFVNQ